MAGRSLVIPLAAGTVLIAGVLTFWSQRPPATSAPPPVTAGVRAPSAPISFVTAPPLMTAPKPVEPKRLTPNEALTVLDAEVKRLTALARYPRWSQPLKLTGDGLAEQAMVHIQSSEESASEPVLTVYTKHRIFEAPEPVEVHAHLATPEGPVFANLTANVVDGTGQPLTQLHFTRDGLEYVATFVPPAASTATRGYSIRVQATGPNEEQREVLLEIMYNQPFARLTGNFRDRLENGDLLIEAEVSVQQAARFLVNGSLYGAAEQQIAAAQASAQLEAGTGWVPLRFHGLILREQQVDGPYLLRYVSLTAQTADAEASMRPLHDAYTTQAYVADAFEGEAQQDSQWLAEAALLREHMERLRQEFSAQLQPASRDAG